MVDGHLFLRGCLDINRSLVKCTYGFSTIWFSLARLASTFLIYIFHYLGFLEINNRYHLDFYAILIFCFLSGFFINITKGDRSKWIIRRYFGIMIPYWLVILPVFVANQVFQYKTDLSLTSYIVTAFGGNLFLNNPLYVIAWYISFILMLYAYAFIESFFAAYGKLLLGAFGIMLFFTWLGKAGYFLSFLIGLYFSKRCFVSWPRVNGSLMQKTASVLFVVQKYCYSFFLIHGAILLFFFKITNVPKLGIFSFSIVISSIISIIIYKISENFNTIIINKTCNL